VHEDSRHHKKDGHGKQQALGVKATNNRELQEKSHALHHAEIEWHLTAFGHGRPPGVLARDSVMLVPKLPLRV
jgi:hypothetical protein